MFRNMIVSSRLSIASSGWKTTSCRPSPPPETQERAMPWWQLDLIQHGISLQQAPTVSMHVLHHSLPLSHSIQTVQFITRCQDGVLSGRGSSNTPTRSCCIVLQHAPRSHARQRRILETLPLPVSSMRMNISLKCTWIYVSASRVPICASSILVYTRLSFFGMRSTIFLIVWEVCLFVFWQHLASNLFYISKFCII
jgi:hypothetical protein